MPNEQYPYHMQFNESFAELSQDEADQILEDAISLSSSKSPFTDDFSSSNISTQNSPGTLSSGEEQYYHQGGTLPFEIKQEDLSPKSSTVDLIGNTVDSILQTQQVSEIIPTMDNIGVAPVQNFPTFLQSQLSSDCTGGYSGFIQPQATSPPSTNNIFSFDKGTTLESSQAQNQPQRILDLLQKTSKDVNSKVGKPSKEKVKGQKRVQKAKRLKTEQTKSHNNIQKDCNKVVNAKPEGHLQETSQAFSQVFWL